MERYHKFGKEGQEIECNYSFQIPFCSKKVIDDQEKSFIVRTDILNGTHPLMLGRLTLQKMHAALDLKSKFMTFTVNNRLQKPSIVPHGNHIYLRCAQIPGKET